MTKQRGSGGVPKTGQTAGLLWTNLQTISANIQHLQWVSPSKSNNAPVLVSKEPTHDGDTRIGSQTRHSAFAAKPRIHSSGDFRLSLRNWRQHGDFFRYQCRPTDAPPISAARPNRCPDEQLAAGAIPCSINPQ